MPVVRVPDDLWRRFTELAQKAGKEEEVCLREALERYLEDLEDVFALEEALGKEKEGKLEFVSLEEAKRELGLCTE